MNEMTNEQLRELDAWIAEKVIGRKSVAKISMLDDDSTFHYRKDIGEVFVHHAGNNVRYFHPTSDPAAAMMVLEKCIEKTQVELTTVASGEYRIRDLAATRGEYFTTFEKSLPLAICLFARELFKEEKP